MTPVFRAVDQAWKVSVSPGWVSRLILSPIMGGGVGEGEV